MEKQPPRVLIFDTDPNTLMTPQHLLEDVGIDATITWDEDEALQLVQSKLFNLLLVGDHPHELDAADILENLSIQATCPPVLILRGIVEETDTKYFRELGAVGVVSKRNLFAVLEQVIRVLATLLFEPASAKACLAEARPWRAAC
jgi:CheY-like chemotaxis protein